MNSSDAFLILLIKKIVTQFGDRVTPFLSGRLAAPLDRWKGPDVLQFMSRLREETSDELLGLATEPCPVGTNRFITEMITRCETLGEALELGTRIYAMITNGITVRLRDLGEDVMLEIVQNGTSKDPQHVLTDWNLMLWHRISEWIIESEVLLTKVEIDHPLDANYSDYSLMFGADCLFNCDTGKIIFPKYYLDRKVVKEISDEELSVGAATTFPYALHLSRTWKQQVRRILRDQIVAGESFSQIEELAAQFNISSQTLRRRLRDEGTGYRQLKADVRRELAIDALVDDSATVSQASAAAGFAESNALTRAMKARSGLSSTQLRDEVRRWRAPQE